MAFVIRFIFLCVLFVGTPLFHSHASTTTSILLFGDSITAGYGLSQDAALNTQLELRLRAKGYDVSVINGGVSGDTTSGGLSRLEWTLNKFNPDIVVIGLGGNDALRAIPPEHTRANLEGMLTILRARPSIQVVLSRVIAPTNLGIDYATRFNAIYPELAQRYGVASYPFYLEPIFGRPEYMLPDTVHPSAAGVAVIADGLSEYLAQHSKLRK